MGEFEYDVRQRSRIAHSAARRKGRGGGRKCTLPSDYLTPAQWRKKNGPVVVIRARSVEADEERNRKALQISSAGERGENHGV